MRLNEFYMQYLNLIDFVMLCSYATEIINFSVRDFFSPPCALKCPKLKRGRHPRKTYWNLMFQGGNASLTKNMAARYMRSKNYLTFFSRSETSVWLVPGPFYISALISTLCLCVGKSLHYTPGGPGFQLTSALRLLFKYPYLWIQGFQTLLSNLVNSFRRDFACRKVR